MLINKSLIEKLKEKYETMDFYISIDAAKKDTYKRIRNGSFETVINSLNLIKDLKDNRIVKNFVISFVVQKENFREIPDYIRMGKEFNTTRVVFAKLKNWRNLPQDLYIQKDVYHPDNKYHKEFIEILKQPILKDKIVSFQNYKNYID